MIKNSILTKIIKSNEAEKINLLVNELYSLLIKFCNKYSLKY